MTVPELEWLSHIMPNTHVIARQIEKTDFSGVKLACCQHITLSSIPMFLSLKKAGADVYVASCNLYSTDDRAVDCLLEAGVNVYAKSRMTLEEYQKNLQRLLEAKAPYLHDMGSDLINLNLEMGHVVAALEATTTGILRLGKNLRFPVYNWNDTPLKNILHNRFHVADAVWPIFSQITGKSLFGKHVAVFGFGPVGLGIAERARMLGAQVSVVEPNEVRALNALHRGCKITNKSAALAEGDVIVTSTGREKIIDHQDFASIKRGAILFNAGHSNQEIHMHEASKLVNRELHPHVKKYETNQNYFFILADGALLNLARGTGLHGREAFDLFEAFMLRALHWLLTTKKHAQPGVHNFPSDIERELAVLALEQY